ncbi:MAG: S1 RNA-binding domain-containing protein [Acutalibacteraceae bacterium]
MAAEVGAIVEGKVTGLTDFGAFVELECGGTGMVHISEVSASYVKNIRDHLKEGQTVKVKILNIAENGRINLSIKKAEAPSDKENGERRPRPARPQGQRRSAPANVWQGQKSVPTQGQSFEEMMARFKQVSDEKITDLKRSSESRHGGYSRKGGNR